MFIDDLKKSILQKAIQGKLVEQNPNDEPASQLLKKIREEKEKLIKDGKIKKEKSLSPITDEEKPFDIPSSWEWVRVRDVCYFGNGEKMSGKKYPYLEARYLRGKDAGKIYSEGNFVEKGNRLILVDGENSGELFDLNENGYLGSTFKIFNTYKSINADYLQKFLTFRKDEFRNNKTGAAIPHLNKDLFFNYPLPLPPLEEQKRIVAKLDELVPLLDEARPLEEEITKLEKDFPSKLRQSILQYAIQGKLVEQNPNDEPASELLKKIKEEKEKLVKEGKIKKEKPLEPIADEEKLFDIPSSWERVRLNDIAANDIKRGKSPKYNDKGSNTLVFAQKCNTKYNGINIELSRYLDEDTLSRYSEEDNIKDGDIIINSTGGGTMGRVGYFRQSDNPKKYKIFPDSHVTIVRPMELVNNRFIHICVKNYQTYMETMGEGSTNQLELKPSIIQNLIIPLPPLEEQKRIVAKLGELLKLCDELEDQIG